MKAKTVQLVCRFPILGNEVTDNNVGQKECCSTPRPDRHSYESLNSVQDPCTLDIIWIPKICFS